jgi:hypothetical protein
MTTEDEINHLLKTDGATLVRHKKHLCYTLSNGKLFTRASTPSSRHNGIVELTTLKRALGIQKNVFVEGERREKKAKVTNGYAPAKFSKPAFNSVLADKLQIIGVTEDSLRDEIAMLNYENEMVRELNEYLVGENFRLENKACECGWCRLRAKTKRLLERIKL